MGSGEEEILAQIFGGQSAGGGGDSKLTDMVNSASGALNSGVNAVKTGFDIYDQYKTRQLNQDMWNTKKKAMNQDYIQKQRDLDWQQRFRDRMLGVA